MRMRTEFAHAERKRWRSAAGKTAIKAVDVLKPAGEPVGRQLGALLGKSLKRRRKRSRRQLEEGAGGGAR
jgi:hypothetical protein